MGFVYTRRSFKSNFEHLLYTYIESGIPVLAGVEGHVVVAFGHRSSFTANLPGSETVYSSTFNDAFVINDDNSVPYQLIQKTGVVSGAGAQASKYNFQEIIDFIVPMPEKVFLPAEDFQTVVTAILEGSEFGFKVLSPSLANDRLVLRLFLTTGKSFKTLSWSTQNGECHGRGDLP